MMGDDYELPPEDRPKTDYSRYGFLPYSQYVLEPETDRSIIGIGTVNTFFESQSGIRHLILHEGMRFVKLGKPSNFMAFCEKVEKCNGTPPDISDQVIRFPTTYDIKTRCNWHTLMGVMNFHFYYTKREPYAITRQGKRYLGSMACAAALVHWAVERPEVLTVDYLASVTETELREVLRCDDGRDVSLFKCRCEMVRETFSIMKRNNITSMYDVFEKYNFCVKDILNWMIANFPAFADDEHLTVAELPYKIYFLKRAQLCLKEMLDDVLVTRTDLTIDMSYLSGFADYRVPQVLWHEGLIYYVPELESHLMNETLTSKVMEIEIRAVTLAAIDVISAITGVDSCRIDAYLWCERRRIGDELDKTHPYHDFLTRAY